MEFVVVSGQSGAGRSQAANYLEDLGWFVIDNLPPALIPKVSELATGEAGSFERVALVVGAGLDAELIAGAVRALRKDPKARVRVIFLQASTPVLVTRYESTRRPHPRATDQNLEAAIIAERDALEVVKAEADLIIDTTDLNVHQLRERIVDAFGSESADVGMQIRVRSFGFKHGLPVDVDLVIDCRFLPNPHWVDELRPLTGRDPAVGEYIRSQDVTAGFLERLQGLLELLIPAYEKEGKSYLTVAFGCTGGQHRAVWVTRKIGEHLKSLGYEPQITHRDVDRHLQT